MILRETKIKSGRNKLIINDFAHLCVPYRSSVDLFISNDDCFHSICPSCLFLDGQERRIEQTENDKDAAHDGAATNHETRKWQIRLCDRHRHRRELKDHHDHVQLGLMLRRFLVRRERVAIRSEVHLVARARIHENVRHHADILVIVVVHRVSSTVQNILSVRLGQILHHIKFGVLRVLSKVLLNGILLASVAERECFKVVLETEVIVDVGSLRLKLFDEPHVAVRGEEKL